MTRGLGSSGAATSSLDERVVIFGAKGRLGKELAEIFPNSENLYDLNPGSPFGDCDITNASEVKNLRGILPERPILFNAAAFTDVDDAEKKAAACYAVNVTGPMNLALLAKETGGLLVHYSSDMVFHRDSGNFPLSEKDPAGPVENLGVYAKSKLSGEQVALNVGGQNTVVLRVAQLYGKHGNNLVDKMKAKVINDGVVEAIDDIKFSITNASDLVETTKALVQLWEIRPVIGGEIYHAVNHGACSPADVAQVVVNHVRSEELHPDPNPNVKIISTSEGLKNRAAPRSRFSVLATQKLDNLGIAKIMPPWTASLRKYLNESKQDLIF